MGSALKDNRTEDKWALFRKLNLTRMVSRMEWKRERTGVGTHGAFSWKICTPGVRGRSLQVSAAALRTFSRWALIRSCSHVATQATSTSETATAGPNRTPSGWAPPLGRPAPAGVQPDIPFRVVRSRYGNLPVYLDYKAGGNRVLTVIRKVEGEAGKLEKMLRAHLGVKGLLSRTDNLIGAVTLGGDHKERTVAWLRTMGF